jgi:hypothetical protein
MGQSVRLGRIDQTGPYRSRTQLSRICATSRQYC